LRNNRYQAKALSGGDMLAYRAIDGARQEIMPALKARNIKNQRAPASPAERAYNAFFL